MACGRPAAAGNRALFAVVCLLSLLLAPSARAQEATDEEPAGSVAVPVLRPLANLAPLAGRPIRRIEVVVIGERWGGPAPIRRVRVGEPFSPEVARRALRELTDSGRYAEVAADAVPEAEGVVLRLTAV